MGRRGKVDFIDLSFDQSTMADIVVWLQCREAGDDFAYVVTPNVDHVVQIERNPVELRPLYKKADLCLCDSRVLARLAMCTGVNLSVVPGSDLLVSLFATVLKDGDCIAVIGGDATTKARLCELYPNLTILQHVAPMGLRHDGEARTAAVAAAVATRARFTLFAVGCPQQEMLAYEMTCVAGATGTGLCIGAAIDFIVGTQQRAPRVLQRLGLEWGWRLARNPRRLARRYLWDGPRIIRILWQSRRAFK